MLYREPLDSPYSPSYHNNSNNQNDDNNNDIFIFCSNWDLWTFIYKFETEMNTFTCALWNEAEVILQGVAAQWCDPLTLQPERSGGVGSIPSRTPSLERHDKEPWTALKMQLYLHLFCHVEH